MTDLVLLPGEKVHPMEEFSYADLLLEYGRCQSRLRWIELEVERRYQGRVALVLDPLEQQAPF